VGRALGDLGENIARHALPRRILEAPESGEHANDANSIVAEYIINFMQRVGGGIF